MPDLRQNPITGRWVVVAPERSGRPVEGGSGAEAGARSGGDELPAKDPGCPFCPGNEAALPEILWELGADEEPGWRCRAVPNRYPAFGEPTGSDMGAAGPRLLREDVAGPVSPGRSHPAVGRQEVLIESARHDRDPTRMSGDEMVAVLELYRRRVTRVTRESPDLFPSLFRNQGPGAGASLVHPHAQLVAARAAGPARRIRDERLQRYRSDTGRCLVCRLTEVEPAAHRRVVEEDERYRAYVPWAPERPLEVWLLPKRHRASFAEADPDELNRLAGILRRTLRRIRVLAGEPDYNYVIHTSAGARGGDPALHWFVQIRPVTARRAGFELDTGVVIAPTSPEDDAERLRGVDGSREEPGGQG